jgi:hypothetical protein
MSPVLHHWPIRKNVTVVAAATALPKGMIIPKTRREIPSTGHCKEINDGKFKGPPKGGPFLIVIWEPKSSGPE